MGWLSRLWDRRATRRIAENLASIAHGQIIPIVRKSIVGMTANQAEGYLAAHAAYSIDRELDRLAPTLSPAVRLQRFEIRDAALAIACRRLLQELLGSPAKKSDKTQSSKRQAA